MSTIFTDRHIKTCQFSNLRLFWKSLLPFFRRTYALSVGLEIKTLRKSVFQCLDFYCPFLLSIWYESHFSNTVLIMECIELNWLCEHIKKIRSSQPTFLVLNWLNHQSFPVSIVKTILFPSSLPFLFIFFFFQEVRCITTKTFVLMSYNSHVIVYKWLVRYRFCTVLLYIYMYTFFYFNV